MMIMNQKQLEEFLKYMEEEFKPAIFAKLDELQTNRNLKGEMYLDSIAKDIREIKKIVEDIMEDINKKNNKLKKDD